MFNPSINRNSPKKFFTEWTSFTKYEQLRVNGRKMITVLREIWVQSVQVYERTVHFFWVQITTILSSGRSPVRKFLPFRGRCNFPCCSIVVTVTLVPFYISEETTLRITLFVGRLSGQQLSQSCFYVDSKRVEKLFKCALVFRGFLFERLNRLRTGLTKYVCTFAVFDRFNRIVGCTYLMGGRTFNDSNRFE